MHKTELIEKVSNATESSKVNTAKIVDAVFDTIADTLKKGQNVTIIGFGTFSVNKLKARKGRNLRTGEIINIPARKAPKFKASSNLKSSVKGSVSKKK